MIVDIEIVDTFMFESEADKVVDEIISSLTPFEFSEINVTYFVQKERSTSIDI